MEYRKYLKDGAAIPTRTEKRWRRNARKATSTARLPGQQCVPMTQSSAATVRMDDGDLEQPATSTTSLPGQQCGLMTQSSAATVGRDYDGDLEQPAISTTSLPGQQCGLMTQSSAATVGMDYDGDLEQPAISTTSLPGQQCGLMTQSSAATVGMDYDGDLEQPAISTTWLPGQQCVPMAEVNHNLALHSAPHPPSEVLQTPNVEETRRQHELLLMTLKLKHGLTDEALEDTLKVINVISGKHAVSSKLFFYKSFDEIRNNIQFHHECVAQLNMRQLLSVGMDGPNVNFKLMDLLQKEHAELHGGAQVINVGSCGLHTLHNAMKAGFTA
ncbi:uncharacterized protein LOC126404646 [Epinephelus moara]|uniref:uncharacterized protein LOC126404646 n=1 Tax=Epinephelus moara TaxID=300413 RepID=UPI00214E5F73|nr:uncharacterized protein LOC126404646 [Epinephelus moara]